MDLILKFFTTNTGEIELKKILVTVIIAFITAFVSIFTSITASFINSSRNKKTTYINTITSNRIKWMQEMKGFIDTFIRKTQVSYYSPIYNDIKERIQYFEELSSIRNKIFLHLNYRGYLDDKIMTSVNIIYSRMEMIYELDTLLKIDDVNDKIKYILKHYHKDILNQLLELIDVNLNDRQEIIDSLEVDKEIPAVLQEAINKEITKFNNKFRNAPQRIVHDIQDFHNELVMYTQIYLKLEWDRVKDESKSKLKPQDVKKYKKTADEMIDGYNLKLYNYSLEKLPNYLR